jgi:hypothetical protein
MNSCCKVLIDDPPRTWTKQEYKAASRYLRYLLWYNYRNFDEVAYAMDIACYGVGVSEITDNGVVHVPYTSMTNKGE